MEEKRGKFGRCVARLHSGEGVDFDTLPKRVQHHVERLSDPNEGHDWVQFKAEDDNIWMVARTWDDKVSNRLYNSAGFNCT